MKFVARLFCLFALTTGFAHATDVVKVMNFSCPICRAAENTDVGIREELAATGGRLVPAPLPADDTTPARELVYYASRLQGQAVEEAVRKSLYKGAQDMQMPLEDVAETVAWLQDDLTGASIAIDWSRLVRDAGSDEVQGALARAARIALRAGAQKLPLYVVLKNNQVLGAFDPQSTGTGSLLTLRDAVIKAVRAANSTQ